MDTSPMEVTLQQWSDPFRPRSLPGWTKSTNGVSNKRQWYNHRHLQSFMKECKKHHGGDGLYWAFEDVCGKPFLREALACRPFCSNREVEGNIKYSPRYSFHTNYCMFLCPLSCVYPDDWGDFWNIEEMYELETDDEIDVEEDGFVFESDFVVTGDLGLVKTSVLCYVDRLRSIYDKGNWKVDFHDDVDVLNPVLRFIDILGDDPGVAESVRRYLVVLMMHTPGVVKSARRLLKKITEKIVEEEK